MTHQWWTCKLCKPAWTCVDRKHFMKSRKCWEDFFFLEFSYAFCYWLNGPVRGCKRGLTWEIPVHLKAAYWSQMFCPNYLCVHALEFYWGACCVICHEPKKWDLNADTHQIKPSLYLQKMKFNRNSLWRYWYKSTKYNQKREWRLSLTA